MRDDELHTIDGTMGRAIKKAGINAYTSKGRFVMQKKGHSDIG